MITVTEARCRGWRIWPAQVVSNGNYERVAHHSRIGDAIGFGKSLYAVRRNLLQDIELKESMYAIFGRD